MTLTLLMVLEGLGLHPVSTAELNQMEIERPGGTRELLYRDADPKAGLGESLEVEGARSKLLMLLGEPAQTPLGQAWLFAFDDEPHCGFALSATRRGVYLREWTAHFTGRYWTPLEAQPITMALMAAVEDALFQDGAAR